MTRLIVCDRGGVVTAEVRIAAPQLATALMHDKADAVVGCAMLMALSSLAQGGRWPRAALRGMAQFMGEMRNQLVPPMP